jgi:tetratricopeptide (TPR) repeat protein
MKWQHPFRSETDVANRFLDNLERLRTLSESLGEEFATKIKSIPAADSQYRAWAAKPEANLFTNMFLAPAVNAAITVAQELEKLGRHQDAFFVSNVFGEMCKILIARSRDKFIHDFEEFVLIACCATSGLSLADPSSRGSEDQGEIEMLRKRMHHVCDDALGTFFRRDGRFSQTKRPETDLGDWAVNEALARHFDRQLHHLLEANRPGLKDYARENMPSVYRMKLTGENAGRRREEWERLLIDAGYDDVLRLMKDMGDLVNPDEVGIVSVEQRNDVMRAAASNDKERVAQLLENSAKELKTFLYTEAQLRLSYREPKPPNLRQAWMRSDFNKLQRLSKTDDPDKLRTALGLAQAVWQEDVGNLNLRDWVAYLQAKTGNLTTAQQMLDEVRKRRGDERSFATQWNLAVLAYDRKDEDGTYKLLLPLIADEGLDEDLVIVVLALSLKLDDTLTFLAAIPQTMSLRFHPLAVVVALKLGDAERVEKLLGQLFRHWQGGWELPPFTTQFSQDFEKTVNKAIVEGQVEQLITWLRARIKNNRNWMPNYFELARVLEQEFQDYEDAFSTLRDAYRVGLKKQPVEQAWLEGLCRDMLALAKRCVEHARTTKSSDAAAEASPSLDAAQKLGRQAYRLAEDARVSEALLHSFRSFAPQEPSSPPTPLPPLTPSGAKAGGEIDGGTRPPRDPKVADRLVWVTARLAGIRSVAAYVEQADVIEQFAKVVNEINPQESATALELVRNASDVFETFAHTDATEHDSLRSLYDRARMWEKRLTQLIRGGAVSQHLADVLTPYCQVLQQVVGDLSRRAGVGPIVDASIENPFISLDAHRSTVVLRVTNRTERPISDVLVDLLIESPHLAVVGKHERLIVKMDQDESRVLTIPVEFKSVTLAVGVDKILLGISLRASAEGFPNVEIGILKKEVPVKTFEDAIGAATIPKLFEIGDPLKPSDPGLFHGRNETLNKIKSSFYGGVQRERYFLDGIRRAGKTSILNFLPTHLPDTIIPIPVSIEKLSLRGAIDSGDVLWKLCRCINESYENRTGAKLSLPDVAGFKDDSARAFGTFLNECRTILPEHVPLLMFDEFQDLLIAIARTGSSKDRDTVALDALRVYLEEGRVYAVFTGSVRFDRLSEILEHRIFGSLTRLRVSFLTPESVANVLGAGIEQWAILLPETIDKVFELTGGYPWLVQKYGAALVDLLNEEHRTVATPEDVEIITENVMLCDKELFSFWWPTDQLGLGEEHFIEWLFRKYPAVNAVDTRVFFADVNHREQAEFRRAFENLRACEVLDSTDTQYLRFRGVVLRRWLEQQMQDGQLKIPKSGGSENGERGHSGIFIDHENMIRSLERISSARGIPVPRERVDWFSGILSHLVEEAEHRVGRLSYKVTVAFWDRPGEAALGAVYARFGFDRRDPERVKLENAVDFKVADEVRRTREQAMREGTQLSRAIVVCGDGDLSHAARALVNDGVSVQIWGGSRSTSNSFAEIVGSDNVVVLDDVCGL